MKMLAFLSALLALIVSGNLSATVLDFRNETILTSQGQVVNGDEWLDLGLELSTPDNILEVGCYGGPGTACLGASIGVQDFDGRMVIRFVDPGTTNQASTLNVNVDFCCETNLGSTDSTLYDINGQVITTFTDQDIVYQGGTPVGWVEVQFGTDAIYTIEFDSEPIQQSRTATFAVTKDFTDNNPAAVEVTLTCNSGLPLEQSFIIADEQANAPQFGQVTFTVREFVDGQTDCTVTETPVENYTPSYDNGTTVSAESCAYTSVAYGDQYQCAITNAADPGDYTVAKQWIIGESGFPEESYEVDIEVNCSADIIEVDGTPVSPSLQYSGTLEDGESVVLTVNTESGAVTCSATEDFQQSGVEPSASEGCSNARLEAGGTADCLFTNTVFFEGIPALDRFGMAVLVLLMLGVGYVGLRRYA